MAKEIERKFLVKGNFKEFVSKSQRITQGYLSSVPKSSCQNQRRKRFFNYQGNCKQIRRFAL
jgi:CYTH domain-containing protein